MNFESTVSCSFKLNANLEFGYDCTVEKIYVFFFFSSAFFSFVSRFGIFVNSIKTDMKNCESSENSAYEIIFVFVVEKIFMKFNTKLGAYTGIGCRKQLVEHFSEINMFSDYGLQQASHFLSCSFFFFHSLICAYLLFISLCLRNSIFHEKTDSKMFFGIYSSHVPIIEY